MELMLAKYLSQRLSTQCEKNMHDKLIETEKNQPEEKRSFEFDLRHRTNTSGFLTR